MTGQRIAAGDLLAIIDRELPPALARELPDRRWFGDKDRSIDTVEIIDAVVAEHDDRPVGWALAEVRFVDGAPARYALPLAVTSEPDAASFLDLPVRGGVLTDGANDPAFAGWWLRLLAKGGTLRTRAGSLGFTPETGLEPMLGRALGAGGQPLGGEQSNSAIRFGDASLVKLFRRIAPGVNPDIEIGLELWRETPFRNIPEPLGVVTYRGPGGDMAVSFAQRWTENEGDGWTWLLGALTGWMAGGAAASSRRNVMDDIRLLGRRTGELHRALADCLGPDFAPHPLGADDLSWMISHAQDNLTLTLDALRSASNLDEQARVLSRSVLDREADLRDRLSGMESLAGTCSIRVHGDYHLGQVLRTPDDDWVILDFEGEPARPSDERRLRQPALKDVGGMLRSFAYARGAALDAVASRGAALPPDTLETWEADARRAFIEDYRAAARGDAPAISPQPDRAFARALDAWELDKALYEVRYELANRPAWAALPLAALASPPRR